MPALELTHNKKSIRKTLRNLKLFTFQFSLTQKKIPGLFPDLEESPLLQVPFPDLL